MKIYSLPFEELKRERERLATLHQYNLLHEEADEEYEQIVQIASYICGTPISLMSLVDADKQHFKIRLGLDVAETSREVSFCSHAIQHRELMEVNDAMQDARFKTNALVTGDPGIRFYAGAPLITSSGHALGTLCVIDRVPKKLTAEQKQHLQTLSRQLVNLIELRFQQTKLREMNQELLVQLEGKLEEQTRVLNLFQRFVPDEVIAKHLSNPSEVVDDAETKHVVVLFCDMRGYTSLVEKLNPSQAVEVLKNYYSVMSDVISTYSGMVNQYVGDEIFATFGAPFSFPDYERNAVFCAIEMMRQVDKINQACSHFLPAPIKIGIGLHAGDVVTGTLGSKTKIEYAVTGDTVNTGKRIESHTQDHPNTILISQDVYDKVATLLNVKAWTPIKVKGKAKPIAIYEVLGRKDH